MRSYYLTFLALPPPFQSFLRRSALPLEHVLYCELLKLVPSHLEWPPIVRINQVENRLVIYLNEGNEDFIAPV